VVKTNPETKQMTVSKHSKYKNSPAFEAKSHAAESHWRPPIGPGWMHSIVLIQATTQDTLMH